MPIGVLVESSGPPPSWRPVLEPSAAGRRAAEAPPCPVAEQIPASGRLVGNKRPAKPSAGGPPAPPEGAGRPQTPGGAAELFFLFPDRMGGRICALRRGNGCGRVTPKSICPTR